MKTPSYWDCPPGTSTQVINILESWDGGEKMYERYEHLSLTFFWEDMSRDGKWTINSQETCQHMFKELYASL